VAGPLGQRDALVDGGILVVEVGWVGEVDKQVAVAGEDDHIRRVRTAVLLHHRGWHWIVRHLNWERGAGR
jgi:hypothetical protein